VIYIVYLFIGNEPNPFKDVQIVLKVAEVCLDLYLAFLFVRAVHFL